MHVEGIGLMVFFLLSYLVDEVAGLYGGENITDPSGPEALSSHILRFDGGGHLDGRIRDTSTIDSYVEAGAVASFFMSSREQEKTSKAGNIKFPKRDDVIELERNRKVVLMKTRIAIEVSEDNLVIPVTFDYDFNAGQGDQTMLSPKDLNTGKKIRNGFITSGFPMEVQQAIFFCKPEKIYRNAQ